MILVTGFEPFADLESNPSEDIARTLEDRDVDCCVLPVDYASFGERLREALDGPWDAVLMLGVAVDRDDICLERIARNQSEPGRRDNLGQVSLHREVVAGGPAAYFSTLPLDALQERLVGAGLPTRMSIDAGAFFCNAAFYLARHSLGTRRVPCGFVHLPPTPEIAGEREGMTLTAQVGAVRLMLDALRDL